MLKLPTGFKKRDLDVALVHAVKAGFFDCAKVRLYYAVVETVQNYLTLWTIIIECISAPVDEGPQGRGQGQDHELETQGRGQGHGQL